MTTTSTIVSGIVGGFSFVAAVGGLDVPPGLLQLGIAGATLWILRGVLQPFLKAHIATNERMAAATEKTAEVLVKQGVVLDTLHQVTHEHVEADARTGASMVYALNSIVDRLPPK